MLNVVCKGSWSLGTACGHCERCAAEPRHAVPHPGELMDHRDVIDAARKLVDEGGHVKFRLPVGAFLGGMYHLGNGVFVAKLPSPSDSMARMPQFREPPDVLGLHGDKAVLEAQGRFVKLELCDNPLPASFVACRRVIPTHLVVPFKDAVTGVKVLRSVETGKVVK